MNKENRKQQQQLQQQFMMEQYGNNRNDYHYSKILLHVLYKWKIEQKF